jgi:hypothetical protein
MTVLLASLKSVSSVAAQKTGATGTPVASWREFANASAVNAFANVYIGPPKSPGCWPVVTTTPRPAATESSRSFALPVASMAGWSFASQSFPRLDRTDSRRSRHEAESCGRGSYHPRGAAPMSAAAAIGFPLSGTVMTRGFTCGSRTEWCAESFRTKPFPYSRQSSGPPRSPPPPTFLPGRRPRAIGRARRTRGLAL